MDISFRGKGIDTDLWFYGGYAKEYNDDGEEEFYIVDDPFLIPVKKETVGQSTGIEDSNGNLIYKGDIVSFYNDKEYIFKPTKAVVIYDSGAFMLEHEKMGKEYLREINIEDMCIKVIGNIHDNSKLLKA